MEEKYGYIELNYDSKNKSRIYFQISKEGITISKVDDKNEIKATAFGYYETTWSKEAIKNFIKTTHSKNVTGKEIELAKNNLEKKLKM